MLASLVVVAWGSGGSGSAGMMQSEPRSGLRVRCEVVMMRTLCLVLAFGVTLVEELLLFSLVKRLHPRGTSLP